MSLDLQVLGNVAKSVAKDGVVGLAKAAYGFGYYFGGSAVRIAALPVVGSFPQGWKEMTYEDSNHSESLVTAAQWSNIIANTVLYSYIGYKIFEAEASSLDDPSPITGLFSLFAVAETYLRGNLSFMSQATSTKEKPCELHIGCLYGYVAGFVAIAPVALAKEVCEDLKLRYRNEKMKFGKEN